ncbi:MAG: hypothetical protein ACYCX2_02075 [Christensenellales bacterium]
MDLFREIERNFPKIEKLCTESIRRELSTSFIIDLGKFNYGFGTMIRLRLLRPFHVLYKHFISNGYTDLDEMSMEVMRAFHKYMVQKEN